MTWASRIEVATNVVLMVAAVVLLGIFARSRTIGAGVDRGTRETAAEEVIDNWQEELSTGIRMGRRDAPIRIIEFMDFQCPFCRQLAHRVDTLTHEYPGMISITMHHFPLTNHPLALPAAIGAECADEQGVFAEYFRAVFLGSDPLGVHSLDTYGERAGARNLDRFRECLSLPVDSFPRIAYGLDLGRRTDLRGTPTVWFEGLRLIGTPGLDRLRQLVDEAIASRGLTAYDAASAIPPADSK